MRALRRELREAAPLRARIALGLVLGSCAVGAGVALMGTSGYLISRAALRPPILSLAVAIVAVRFFGVSRGVFRYLERIASHDAALRLLGALRARFYDRLEPLVPDALPSGLRTGDLLGRFVGDVDDQQHLFVRALGPTFVAVLVSAGAVVAVLLIDARAGLVLLAALAAGIAVVPAVAARLVRTTAGQAAPARAALLTEVLDTLESSAELTVAGRIDASLERVWLRERELAHVRRRAALAGGVGDGLVTLLAGAAVIAVVTVAAPTVRGVLLGAVALVALASFESVRPLPAAAEQLAATDAAAARIYELIDRDPVVADPQECAPEPQGNELRAEEIVVSGILDGVGLTVRRGSALALVGPSGVGKTTLAHCLVRFRDPNRGRVLLDGRDVREYRQDDLRRAVLLLDQDAHLFATTLRENVRLARPDATDDEVREALRSARLLDWVEALPDGLDTFVGEQGRLLSGGQRQRVALARAFLSRAGIVIFDEPTAHLDDETAHGIVDTILELALAGRGVLMITHAPYGLDRFDAVLELAHE